MKILKLFLKVSYENVKFSKRGFYKRNDFIVNQLENVGRYFLMGYHKSLEISSLQDLFFTQIDKLYQGFVFEGASMGLTIRDFFSLNKSSKINDFITSNPNHIYILHVGVGWAYARLPLNIEKSIEKFDPFLRWLIIDGYGFHQAYFKTKKYVYEMYSPTALKNSFTKHVFYQGLGRALWFVEGTDCLRIYNRVNCFPVDFQADLWAGIGLGAAYAGGGDEADYQLLKRLSGEHLGHLCQGVAFAATARLKANNVVEHTKIASKIICNLELEELVKISNDSLNKVPSELSSEKKYATWRDLIRQNIIKLNKHESFF